MKRNKYLFVKGVAGLGNRLFCVADAIDHAIKSDRILYVDWTDGGLGPREKNMFCRYFRLKGIASINSIAEIDDVDTLSYYPAEWKNYPGAGTYDHYKFCSSRDRSDSKFDRLRDRILCRISKGYRSRQYGYWKLKDPKRRTGYNGYMPAGQFISTTRQEDVIIYSDFAPLFKGDLFREHIALESGFLDKINVIRNELFAQRPVIGIHIRSTDKQPDKNINTITELILSPRFKDHLFFISTDNVSIYNDLKKIENVLVYNKVIPVPDKGGVHGMADSPEYSYPEQMFEDSLTDLWLLSLCDILWYQGNSTFSVIARALHGKPEYQWDWNSQSVTDIRI